MTGMEFAVGYLFAWAVRKAKRVAGRADEEVDRTLDAAMDELHDLVSRKLGEDTALQRLADEAEAGQEEPSGRTRQRVQLALEDAAEHDQGFAEALDRALGRLQFLSRTGSGVSAGDSGQAIGGNVEIRADHASAAAWNMENVTVGNPPQPGPTQG
ncbi:hypothetical protein [Kitasatospora sp. GP82]|uniref:hypothetical protein n=1 Tax=Kitasatospora sp. GP82 TaxID=3035089 RepID=UPI00247522E1|nr:hypothetical protein [Kitasatospora sp. GP82]MDH6130090.1 hypothetical protein [Kitasatospora sp. GP82]